jgi:O-antigen biosynthesis protein
MTEAEDIKPKYNLEGLFNPAHAHPDDAHSILMRLVPENSRVLELGCSSGYLSGYLVQEKQCYVTGFELDPVAAKVAATRCNEVFTVDLDRPNAILLQDSYDVLLAPAVLEHLKYPQMVLETIRSKLRRDATVLVSLPNIAHWSMRLNLLRGKFDYTEYGLMDKTHVHFYTIKTGRDLLERSGYSVENMYIAGSGIQNILNAMLRRIGKSHTKLLWPSLLGYELIFLAHPKP